MLSAQWSHNCNENLLGLAIVTDGAGAPAPGLLFQEEVLIPRGPFPGPALMEDVSPGGLTSAVDGGGTKAQE